MQAEFIAVSGPLVGARFPLDAKEVQIGRAPSCDIRLADPEAAWVHCAVIPRDGGFRIVDRRTGSGTYVNGMRVTEQVLEPGDQISIGETILVYRESPPEPARDSVQHTVLRVCSLLFLFRAIAESHSESRATLDCQMASLLSEIVPCLGGAVLLGDGEEDLRVASRGRSEPVDLGKMAARAAREGVIVDAADSSVAIPLYVRGAVAGVLIAWFAPEEAVNLSDHRDTLIGVATLAASALENVNAVERLRTENSLLRERIDASETGIVGESIAIHKLLEVITRVAPQETPVLILGESGTGKELVARALHRLSPRAGRPFIAINCAALTETLLESELFGHEKGAFTGAVAQKKGKLEMAEGGTVFLDEIGEMVPQLQAKLLRVLQQREFERVGGTRTLKLDARLIAATNRELSADVRSGAFREDLYHRLNVISVRVPPLRERPGDILPLARYFLDRSSVRCGRRVTDISSGAEACLLSYSWPGNVRELENAIERAVVLGETDSLLPEDLPEGVLDTADFAGSPEGLQSSVVDTKRQTIISAWQKNGGDHDKTAASLGIHPNSLRRLIRTLNLRHSLVIPRNPGASR
jgi:two-component system response regulator HydG